MNLLTDPLLKEMEIIKNTPVLFEYKDGEDFYTWKKEGRKKLLELIGWDKFKPCELNYNLDYKEENETFTEYRFTFESEKNYLNFPIVFY